MQILYAIDGSTSALAGAAFLAALPLDADSTINLLTVTDGDQSPEAPIQDEAYAALHDTDAALQRYVRQGYPAEAILHAAEERQADIIVVGTQGRSAIARFFLGSVAEWVARHADRSVLVARPLHGSLDTVVIGVDGSAGSEAALRLLETFPLPPTCQIRLVTVLVPNAAVDSASHMLLPKLSDEVHMLARQQHTEAERRLNAAADRLVAAGRHVRTEIRAGSAPTELIGVASELAADLLVVGAQGLSALDHFLIGNISERVLRHAPCSVLCVRPPVTA